ncbi:hypothetical protein JTE90_015380 [Oedothorax gibbosus]|uniref:Exonuclease domain-containing protein n=1 Tax=Oedothorax gibbosus TaxID=931172 RepID=A0AAV6U2Z1_9ARAC|nr:hypothetical protein JTE90_015380 [Oedothorax gibbosus]
MSTRRNQRAGNKKNAKKLSTESQIAESNSVVFLVPVSSINAMNSTTVSTSMDGASVTAPKPLSSSCPELINGKKVYIIPNNSSLSANSFNIGASNAATRKPVFVLNKSLLANSSPNIAVSNPVLNSPVFILNNGQLINSSPIAATSPNATNGRILSPKITGAALQTSVLKERPVVNSSPITSALPNANNVSNLSPKITGAALQTSVLKERPVVNSSPITSALPNANNASNLSPKITGAALQTNVLKESPVTTTPTVTCPKPEVFDENPFMNTIGNSITVATTPTVLNPKGIADPYLNALNASIYNSRKPINISSCATEVSGVSFDLDSVDENSYSKADGSLNTSASPITANRAGISPKVLGSVFTKSPNVNSSPIAASSPTAAVCGVLSPINNGPALEPNKGAIAKNIKKKPQCKRPADKAIATYVFFDLETTGLGHEIGKPNVQITEISMIAMKRKEFENSSSTELKDIRIIQKISLCTRPRSSVSWGAAKVTGLNDSNLYDQEPFDQNAASAIIAFLNHLPKPVCILAHNGATYDYPLFKAELNRLSINLSSDILIADTLKAFRELGVPVFPPERKVPKSVKYGARGISYALDNLHLYFFGKKPVGGHSSEGDCIALAKVCQSMKDLMLPWIDENCTTMDTVVPMW